MLEAAGHDAVAVELRSDEPGSTCTLYSEIVAEELGDRGDDVIVVGHSFGGLTIPLVAARRPVARLVYLAALIPSPGISMSDQFAAERGILVAEGGRDLDDENRTYWSSREKAIGAMYADCSPEDAEWAWERLRPQSRDAQNERCPLDEHPDVPVDYLVCTGDRMVSPDWGAQAARDRLGVEPLEIAAGHTPHLSRPEELARLLTGLG
jgi:pimeloyl-ACP methyl ester carboxylesterase